MSPLGYLHWAAYGNGSFIERGFGPEPFQMKGRRAEAQEAVNKAAGQGEGDRLFFRSLDGDTVFSVEPPTPGEGTSFSLPSVVLAGHFGQGGAIHQKGYDLAPDGRFVMRKTVGGYPAIQELRVVVGWDVGLSEAALVEERGW